jgi:hypothetical protein
MKSLSIECGLIPAGLLNPSHETQRRVIVRMNMWWILLDRVLFYNEIGLGNAHIKPILTSRPSNLQSP